MSDVTYVFSTSWRAWLGVSKSVKELQIGSGIWYLGLVWGWKWQREWNLAVAVN